MTISRRMFVAMMPLTLLARTAKASLVRRPKHPDPRPGITAARVLPDGALKGDGAAAAAAAFAMVREIPQIVDGIRCNCGCAELAGFYSLLSCYEQAGMAQHCIICQGEARLAYTLHAEGWSLNGIRKAIDAEFGD